MTPPHAPLVRPAADAAERAALGEVLSFCFAFPPEDTAPWFERAGAGEVRVAALGDEVAGGWINVPMGQHWGDRSVPLLGIAGVGIAPQHRGKGLARAMMRAAVAEARSRGQPLLGLFASTQDLYRRAGFEQPGVLGNVRLDPAHLLRRAGAVPVCALGPDDEPAVARAYAEIAQHRAPAGSTAGRTSGRGCGSRAAPARRRRGVCAARMARCWAWCGWRKSGSPANCTRPCA
jgi:ribosomal protein S18 acetylase RimI-like enzyme